MTYRRTWLGYVLWILYTILCIVLLAAAGNVWVSYFAGRPYTQGFPDSIAKPFAGLSGGVLTMLGLLVLPIAAALYWVIRGIAARVGRKCVWKERSVQAFECIVAAIAFAGGIFLRIDSAGFYLVSLAGDESLLHELVSGMDYYYMAVVTTGEGVPSMVYGAAYLYVLLLSVVLSFLGNKVASAVILQVFLQIAGMALVYAVTRKIAGRLPACVALIYMACSFSNLRMLVSFGPEWFFFDLYLLGMLCVVCLVKGYCANRMSKVRALVCACLTGAGIGALAYLDMTAVTLFIVLTAVFTGKKAKQEEMPVRYSSVMNAGIYAAAIVAGVLCWFGVLAAVSYGRGTSLADGLRIWAEFYGRNMRFSGFAAMYPYIYDVYIMGIQVVFASFLIFEIFRDGREQNYTLWILLCILAAPTPRAVMGVQPFGILSLYIWSVLAGLGLQNCIFGGKRRVMQAMIKEINSAAEGAEEAEQAEIVREIAQEIEKIRQEKNEEQAGDADRVREPAQDAFEEQKPRFIENPLPLPKKHVKKEMDYQYPVAEHDMKYDVDVAEDDDFDIC